jgi:hypothetical protein
MRTLLSLFDETGNAARPYHDAGWNVIQVDLAHGDDVRDFSCEHLLEMLDEASHIICQPPCTDFTVSGARWWNDKDADGRTAASAELVRQALRTIDFLKPDVWWLENPIGRIATIVPELGARRAIIQPWQYGRYNSLSTQQLIRLEQIHRLGEAGHFDQISEADIELTKRADAYTKATGLWGRFTLPEPQPIAPCRVCKQGSWLMKLGGKSERTKSLRSATPSGFAAAMFQANQPQAIDWSAIDESQDSDPYEDYYLGVS